MKNTNGVRKSPISEVAAMLWRNMVIKFDNHPGLVNVNIFEKNYKFAMLIKLYP